MKSTEPEPLKTAEKSLAIEVGLKIMTARKAKRLTQQELAEASGVDRTYISRIELGAINASLDKYVAILRALGLKFEDVIEI